MTVTTPTRLKKAARTWVRANLLSFWPREGAEWDRRAGVNTDEWAELSELTVDSASRGSGHAYGPTPPRLVRALFDAVPERLLESCTFVDLGSGRGRVVLMASERPFRRVRGVEFAAELHESAVENLRRFPAERIACSDVDVIHGDATAFQMPEGGVFLYFDNPFGEDILGRVLDNLATSYAADPRPVVCVYTQQHTEEVQSTTGNIGLLDEIPFLEGETLRYPVRDRLMLNPFVVRIYYSPEARAIAGR
jgi:16S rRNA G966 N2-methylase RsmD